MKLCPKCQANVEGLVNYCDCCGASLDTQIHLFTCICHDFPECLGFSALVFDLMDRLEPTDPAQYTAFLEKISFELFCYPESIILAEKLRNRVFYSAKKRFARVTVIVDYNKYVFSERAEKATLVEEAIYKGILLLQARLHKEKLDISGIVEKADNVIAR